MNINLSFGEIEFKQYININDKSLTYDWHGKILIEKEEVEFEIYGNCLNCGQKLAKEINWDCIKGFLEYYKDHHLNLIKKSYNPLSYLIRQINWWKEEELAIGNFKFTGVIIKTIDCKSAPSYNDFYYFDLCFDFVGSSSNYWLDTYGLWLVSFKGPHLIGVRREQT